MYDSGTDTSSNDEGNSTQSVVNRQNKQVRDIESNRQRLRDEEKEKKRIDKLTYKDKDDIYG